MQLILLSPLTWGLLLAAVLVLAWSRMGTALRVTGIALGVVVLVLCMPLGGNALLGHVESQLPDDARCLAPGSPIVVLSGGLDDEPRAGNDYAALTLASWRRLFGAVALWRASPGSPMVIAGGGPFRIKESAVLASLARDWGVPAAVLRTESASTTTWESAMALRGTLPTRIRLVSSAEHLPRALLSFRAAGFEPCVEASDSSYMPAGGVGYFLPQLSGIEKSRTALYEMAGMLSYRMRSRPAEPATASR